MANSLTTDLRAMHEAIVSDLRERFPSIKTIEFYSEDRTDFPTPACFLELEEMPASQDDDPGNGLQALEARFVAHLVLGFKSDQSRLSVRLMAAAVAGWLRQHHWTGISHGKTDVAGAYEDDFKPEIDQYDCWRVEWSNVIYVGDDVLDETGFTAPHTVLVSQSPDIGEGNAPKYTQVFP